jgi:thiamine-phosphate pyrophosphorylase
VNKLATAGVYPIVDCDACARHGLAPLAVAERVLRAKPSLLQLRAKDVASGLLLPLLLELRELCVAAKVALVVNDRVDLAALAAVPAVHVGQEDATVSEVRRLAPALAVGVSTHSLAQLQAALLTRPDYVALGPIFATDSKQNADAPLGVQLLAEAHSLARAAAIPLVAIGGIDEARLPEVAAHCDAAAVIGALFTGAGLDGVEAAMQRMSQCFVS